MGTATKQHKKVPKLRFPCYVSDLTSSSLKELTSSVDYRGKAPVKSKEGVFLVTAKNIKKGFIDYDSSKEYVPHSLYNEVMRKGKPKIGDVLFTTEAPLGNVAQVDNEDIALAQRVIKFRGKELLSNSYLKNYFLSPEFTKRISRIAIGSTVQGVSGSDLHRTLIHFPPLEEQKKIADFLGSVDAWLDNLRQQKTALETYKRGMMQKLFKQQVRFKDRAGNNFPDWGLVSGDSLFSTVSERKGMVHLPILAITQEFGAIPRDYIDYKVSVADTSLENYKIVRKGQFIISLRSFQGGIEYSNYDGVCSPAYVVLNPANTSVIPAFYKYYLKYPDYVKKLTSKLEGIRDGKMISFKHFSDTGLPLPSVEEQRKIAGFLTSIDETITAKAEEITKVEQWKKGLMQKMFV